MGSQALALPDVGLLVCSWATSDQQVYDLKWILSFPSARCLDGRISVQFECFIPYFTGKILFIHPFIFTERDLSMLFRHCINLTKLIRSYEDIQIHISFPCVRFAAFSFVFKLQTAWSWKKKKINFFTLGWVLQSDEKLPWWQGLSAAFHQFRFWQSKKTSGYMKWRALPRG